MQAYGNLKGNAGVKAYSIGRDDITIQFADGSVYLYTYASAGMDNIERMKTLAQAGAGLTTFINQHVRQHYKAKLK